MTDITPARVIAPHVASLPGAPPLTDKDRQRRTYILDSAQNALIQTGRAGLTIQQFAIACRMATITIRRYFQDLDHIFAQVLIRHLDRIIAEIGAVPAAAPRIERLHAYLRATRGICDIPTPLHFLLMRDRVFLPPDQLARVEDMRNVAASMLAIPGIDRDQLFAMLDCPAMTAPHIEAALPILARVNDQLEARSRGFRIVESAPQGADPPPTVAPEPEPEPGPGPTPEPASAQQAEDAAIAQLEAERAARARAWEHPMTRRKSPPEPSNVVEISRADHAFLRSVIEEFAPDLAGSANPATESVVLLDSEMGRRISPQPPQVLPPMGKGLFFMNPAQRDQAAGEPSGPPLE